MSGGIQMAMPNLNSAGPLGGDRDHAHAGGCCGGSDLTPDMANIGSNKVGECRRLDLTFDKCISVDLCKEDKCIAARWREDTYSTEIVPTVFPAIDLTNSSTLSAALTEIMKTSVHPVSSEEGLKKHQKVKPSTLTIVVPASLNCETHIKLFLAAQDAGSVKNVFHRPIATVIGAIGRMESELLLKIQHAHKADTDAFLYIYTRREAGDSGKVVFEAAVISAEGKESARRQSNTLGYERVATAAQLHIVSEGGYSDAQMKEDIDGLFKRSGVTPQMVVAVVVEQKGVIMGLSHVVNSTETQKTINVDENDAANGSCLLSAAELRSSKLYMNTFNGRVKLCFLLPVADGYLSYSVGVQKELQDGTKNEVELLFESGLRLPKQVGPARSTSMLIKKPVSLHFEQNSAFSNIASEFPKVHVLQKLERESASEWSLVKTFHPLNRDGDAVMACDMSVSIDASTLVVKVEKSVDGKLVKDVKGWYVKILYFFLFILLCVSSKFGYGYFKKRSELAAFDADVQWLVDVYTQVNPDKLKDDANTPRRIVTKYRNTDKMWMLHRKIEKEYGVKQKKPPSLEEL